MITQKIKEIEKGCGNYKYTTNTECVRCNEKNLCSKCKIKLQATKETAKIFLDNEIEFIQSLFKADDKGIPMQFFRDSVLGTKIALCNREQELQKQREEIE
jgi:hypothetical protein